MISVIIPCHNQAQYLRTAVDSVLVQTRGDHEILIVNDASTDDTLEVGKALCAENPGRAIKVLSDTERHGLSGARNDTIAGCSGEYILPLDADDFLHPSFLDLAAPALDYLPNVDIVYTNRFQFGMSCQTIDLQPINPALLPLVNQLGYCALYRRKCWEQTGGYPDNFPVMGYEDWEFWIQCAEKGFGFEHVPEYLWFYRVRSASMAHEALKKHEFLMNRIILRHPHLYLPETVARAHAREQEFSCP